MEIAQFITAEDGDDLIVSFAILTDEETGDVESLTLLRTPKYEFILDESERGVDVSFEGVSDDRNELLEKLTIEGNLVTITTDCGTYKVSIEKVDPMEIQEAKGVLKKMHFDRRFELQFS